MRTELRKRKAAAGSPDGSFDMGGGWVGRPRVHLRLWTCEMRRASW